MITLETWIIMLALPFPHSLCSTALIEDYAYRAINNTLCRLVSFTVHSFFSSV